MSLIQITEPVENAEENLANDQVIGIDLGTTNSVAAIVKDGEIFFIQEDGDDKKNKNDIIPSIVSFADKNGEKIEIHSIKRLMGKSYFDLEKQGLIDKLAFEVVKNSDAKTAVKIKINDQELTAAEISAKILAKIKNIAEKNLQKEIKKAVITVPAYFDEAAKNATKLAANIAGLEVLRLINEPTAAAFAYGLDNKSEGTYCVFDLGGGTFDVSILKMQKGIFKVLGVSGDNQLGGDDIDYLIAEKVEVDKLTARKIKEEFSISDQSNGLTKIEFEKLISPLVEKTMQITTKLIENLDLTIDEIDGLIMVGGSTRVSLIKKRLSEIFGCEKILDNIDPDRIVACGAARQADNLSNKNNQLLLDVLPLSLGVEMMGGIVDKIIYRNSTIPIAKTKEFTTYADNQTAMKLHIVQGERELAADCRSLAEFEIKKILPLAAGIARVQITFRVDADGILTVSAEEKFSGEKQEIIVKPFYGIDENEIKKILLESFKNSQDDIQKRLLIQAIIEAKKDLAIITNDLKILANQLEENEKKLIEQKLAILEQEIAKQNSREAIIKAQKELSDCCENLVLMKVNAVLQSKIAGKKINDFDQ
jgi:molecular chaperone HscA